MPACAPHGASRWLDPSDSYPRRVRYFLYILWRQLQPEYLLAPDHADLTELAETASEFLSASVRRLPKDYPASILRDDALYELAVTLHAAHDAAGACAAVKDLKKLDPDSKYVARTAELCP